jgi:hypothetical protein
MQSAKQPYEEIARAKRAMEQMQSASNFEEFEEHWKEFLRRLERSWNEVCAHYSKSPKWLGWNSKYERQRRTDQLLVYLINAIGADEHTANEIVEHEGGSICINPASGNYLHIEKMTIRKGKLNVKSPQQLKITVQAARTSLLPVLNRGRTYPVPVEHLDKAIDPTNVPTLAGLGLNFYTTAMASAETFFVK